MKKTSIITAALCASAISSQAAIMLNDVIAIDFGETDPATANWNEFTFASNGTAQGNLVSLSNGLDTGVTISVTENDTGSIINASGASFASGAGVSTPSSTGTFTGSGVDSIYGDGLQLAGTSDQQIEITIGGLDTDLTYDIFGGQIRGFDFGQTWSIAGNTPSFDSATDGNGYGAFLGVSTATGSITIVLDDVNNGQGAASRNVGIAELTIVAVPEPSSTALLGLGGLALILRRRK